MEKDRKCANCNHIVISQEKKHLYSYCGCKYSEDYGLMVGENECCPAFEMKEAEVCGSQSV